MRSRCSRRPDEPQKVQRVRAVSALMVGTYDGGRRNLAGVAKLFGIFQSRCSCLGLDWPGFWTTAHLTVASPARLLGNLPQLIAVAFSLHSIP